jgi:hypothetical protein
MTPITDAELEGARTLALQYKLPIYTDVDLHQLVLALRAVLREGSFD